jgi:hypothetical protein
MQHDATNRETLPRAFAPMAIPVALSLALMAFLLMLCGCTVHEEPQPSAARRPVDVKVNIDLNRRPVCPNGPCPVQREASIRRGAQCEMTRRKGDKATRGVALEESSCDCECSGDCGCWQCGLTRRQADKATTRRADSRASGSPCLPLSLSPCHAVPSATSSAATTWAEISRLNQSSPCQAAADYGAESPVMNLPVDARCRNYGGGSCVCASTISLLRWQGRDDLAAALRNTCLGGQSSASLHAKLERIGVHWASTTSGDVGFLEWAVRTRRGCGITYYPMHYVNLVDLTAEHATLLDNNRVGAYITIPRDEFIRRWRGFGGWATAVVYTPAAPLARR